MTRATLAVDGGTDIDVARLVEVCQRYGVAELSLFGSVVHGTATESSDVDVL